MSENDAKTPVDQGGSLIPGPSVDERQAEDESKAETVSKPGGFKNDPDDPTNPNEVRERYNRKLRR
ncbi:MAG: hypothetical protein ABJD53_05115 [Gammaproteobacteria bacterium]